MKSWDERPAAELHVGAHVMLEGHHGHQVAVVSNVAHYQGRLVVQFRSGEARTLEATALVWCSARDAA